MSTGYGREGIRQVCAMLLCARHVPEHLCGGRVYLGCYNKCSTFFYLYVYGPVSVGRIRQILLHPFNCTFSRRPSTRKAANHSGF